MHRLATAIRSTHATALVTFLALIVASSAALAVGPAPSRDWRSAETEHFRVHFEARHRDQAQRIAAIAERDYPRVTAWLNWKPRARTELVLADYLDQANGLATPMPYNTIQIFVAPPDEGELLQNQAWFDLVFLHEFIHIVHLDKARLSPLALRDVFGRFPLLFPNIFQPNWLVEGLAVYGESFPPAKVGRLRNSHFEALMRVEAEKGFISLREINADGRGLPLNRAYLYGAYFYEFLANRYGRGAIPALIDGYSDNLLPFRVHSNPRAATGKPMDELWDEFIADLKTRFKTRITTPFDAQRTALDPAASQLGTPVAGAPYIGSLARGADGSLFFVSYDGITRAELVRRSPDGRLNTLARVARNARLDVDASGAILIAQPEVQDEHDFFYDLFLWTPERPSVTRMTQAGRWREAVWRAAGNSADIVALRIEDDGRGALWRLDRQGQPVERLYRAAADETLQGLAAHPGDGTIVFVSQRDKQWRLLRWANDGISTLLADAAIKHSPRFDAQGGLAFIADYDNVANVWQLHTGADGRVARVRLTHVHTAVTGLTAGGDGGRYVRVLDRNGETIHRLEPGVSSEAPVPIDPATPLTVGDAPSLAVAGPVLGQESAYAAWPYLRPQGWFPVLQLIDGSVTLGAQVFGSDVLGAHQYIAAPMLELTQGEVLGQFSYLYDQRFGIAAERTLKVESTVRGAGKKIESYSINEGIQAIALLPHTRREFRAYAGLGAALDRSTLTVIDRGRQRYQDERVGALILGVDARGVQWASEGPSEGGKIEWIGERGAAGSDFPGTVQHVQVQAFLPLRKAVLAARLRAGVGDERAELFAVGGVEAASLFDLPVVNRRSFGLRGYDGNTQVGSRMRIGTVELRLPIADVDRHLMLPPIGLNRLSLTLFGEAGGAWRAGEKPNDLRARGVELFGELRLGYLVPLALRVGYVEALDGARDKRAYLTVGRAF